MRRFGPRWLKTWAGCMALSLGSVLGLAYAVGAALALEERARVAAALETLGPLPYLLALLLAIVCGFAASWLVRTYVDPLERAREGTELCAGANPDYRIEPDGPAVARALAVAINRLADRYAQTLADVESRVGAARADLEVEKNRLAVLMSELAQSVVVCNAAGVDSGAVLGIAITAADTANGSWFYSINGGTNWNALGAVATNSARLLTADANTRLYFQPKANYFGTLSSALTFRTWDQTSGSNGTLADTTSNGGTTAFSTATDTARLTVNKLNDAPVLDNAKSPLLTAQNEDAGCTLRRRGHTRVGPGGLRGPRGSSG